MEPTVESKSAKTLSIIMIVYYVIIIALLLASIDTSGADLQTRFNFYLARVCQRLAYFFGRIGLNAEATYYTLVAK